ncbi:coagulation factor XIII, A1 polypeptide a, tandem duplicate 1 [Electrophorus electricus]|uniref:coagulation factor XIII, A1 polypeptide a, tandem duplicate 1 n=1 Tax=Electrophorus electricus TaxID=8005 RepID=UPI0015CFDDE9|nr:coagulation factor XIII, A1 polypeptide a, tandem duplicate 1 [Electrophorus electricus]
MYETITAIPRGSLPTIDASTLRVINLNMYEQTNKMAHRTNMYDYSNLIVRRGQEFTLGIVFNRLFNPQFDIVNIEFLIGNNPNSTKRTLITMALGENMVESSKWKGRVLRNQAAETKMGITPAADCIVGLFSTYVTVITSLGKVRTERNPKTDIYILFNAWNPSDMVFMANEDDRTEYVLNSVGIIFNGTVSDKSSRPWNFGQFQQGVLDACLFILDFGKMPLEYRGDVVKVTRKASAMINSQDDNGVLVGNWSNDFSLGTAPTAWTGSAEILLSYVSKGGVPIKYAQCWVYAGVFNTFLRCLGLPSRLITNYFSAHDSLGSIETDIVLDEDGQIDMNYTTDSIWNYHCWNEVFTKRPDIPPVFSGWQAVDATPQETSEGYYRCGPVSVAAVKEGELRYEYDASFVFAEVNSDVVFHKRDKYGNTEVVSVNTTYVGQLILTKMVGSNEPEDITHTYKYPEGSAEDKRSMRQAERQGMRRYHSNSSSLLNVDMQMQMEAKQINTAGDISLTIIVSNLSNQVRTVNITLTCKTDYYTGATNQQFKLITQDMSLQSWETKQQVFTVTANEYMEFITGQPFLSFIACGLISETGMSLTSMAVVHLNAPPLLIDLKGPSQVGMDMYVTVKFTNTAGYDLRDVTIRLEGSDLMLLKTKQYSNIRQGSTVKWTESFTPQMPGSKMLMACLDCAALRNVCGQVDIVIQSKDYED